MKICSAIIHKINFEKQVISPCCNIHARKIPTLPFQGVGFNKEAYIQHIMSTLKNLQVDEMLCRGCDYLENLTDISEQEGFECARKLLSSRPLTHISINHFRNFCNCKCVYCALLKEKQSAPYPILPTLQKLHEEELLIETCQVSWGGGEPSILNEFETTSLWIMEKNYFQKIHTNAIKPSESIARILKNGMCNVDISIDAGTAQTHKEVKGLDIWRQVLTTCQYYRKHARDAEQVSLKYIVFEKNNDKNNIDNFLNICNKINCKNIEISLNFEEINNQTVSQKTLDAIQYLYHESTSQEFTCTLFFIPQKYRNFIMQK